MVSLYISHTSALYQHVLLSVCRIIFYSINLIIFRSPCGMFCLYGANVKDVTPRFGSLRKWRHPEYESGVFTPGPLLAENEVRWARDKIAWSRSVKYSPASF